MKRKAPQIGNFVAYNFETKVSGNPLYCLEDSGAGGGLLLGYKDDEALIAIEAEDNEPEACVTRVSWRGESKVVVTKLISVPKDCVFHAPGFKELEVPEWEVYIPLLNTHRIPRPKLNLVTPAFTP